MQVVAYKAKDGSLHEEESRQIFRDVTILDQSVAEHLQGISKVCSQRTTNRHIAAISKPEEFYEMLSYVIQNHRDMVDRILTDLDAGAELRVRLREMEREERRATQVANGNVGG